MDAVKYIEEKDRMCKTFPDCYECPVKYTCNPDADEAKEAVATVEKWSREHPVMTNGRKLSDMLGNNKRNFTRRNEGKPYVELWIDADWWDAEAPEHDGCKDCRHINKDRFELPCKVCKQCYVDKWEGAF